MSIKKSQKYRFSINFPQFPNNPTQFLQVCNALALTARRLAFDSKHNSPFAMKAREHGFLAPGGKPDDITLVLLLIA